MIAICAPSRSLSPLLLSFRWEVIDCSIVWIRGITDINTYQTNNILLTGIGRIRRGYDLDGFDQNRWNRY